MNYLSLGIKWNKNENGEYLTKRQKEQLDTNGA